MTKHPEILAMATACGATSFTPAPLRAVRGISMTYEAFDEFISKLHEEPKLGLWIAADDILRNVKLLDQALNGPDGATRPLLIDILGQVERIRRQINMPILKAIEKGLPQGYVIERAKGGRWMTIDSIGMPTWTTEKAEAICFSVRSHAETFSLDSDEDVQVKPSWAVPRIEGEHVHAVIACLGDDAATLFADNPDDEMGHNMERAAELLLTHAPVAQLNKARELGYGNVQSALGSLELHIKLEKPFPILGGGSIPWAIIAPFESRAMKTHSQTLKRLSERGGLSNTEALAVLRDVPWDEVKERGTDAVLALVKLVRERIAAMDETGFIGTSDTADFETNQWTFEMAPGYEVGAGKYRITPIREESK
jgi:hypothetical protein